ncbi:MAG: hypothetical protein IT463_01845 [Planctomycetes bacterium]|nr:hypothetical protein [Planctomycetota bacterium]
MNWRRWVIAIHRDVGYFLTGFVLIFATSGIALNHADHWNPNFIITRSEVAMNLPASPPETDRERVLAALQPLGLDGAYLSHDFPTPERFKIYLKDGSITGLLGRSEAELETIRRRPFFFESNTLHVSPSGWWRWTSDAFAAGLILLALTGLFMLRGRAGFLGRGKWFAAAGVALPLLAFLLV